MKTASQNPPLDQDDVARLDALIEAANPESSMTVEELDGYFTALACCPTPVARERWLPDVLGSAELAAAADPALLRLLERHRLSVAATLYEGAGVAPLLSYDEHGVARGSEWAVGFMRGLDLDPEAWDELYDDEEMFDVLDPVVRLMIDAERESALDGEAEAEGPVAGEVEARGDPGGGAARDRARDPGDRSSDDLEDREDPEDLEGLDVLDGEFPPIADDEREIVLHAMFDGVRDVYEYFRDQRERNLAPAEPVRRATAKVGRNDPCPCGSGRKFKHCCGARAG